MDNHRIRFASIALAAVVVVGAAAAVPVAGSTFGSRFIASLRIAKPKPVTAAAPNAGRQLQNVVAGILAETTVVASDEADQRAPTRDSASRLVAFPVRLVGGRSDTSTVDVTGAHAVTVHINGGQLHTLLMEGGQPSTVPASVNGATASLARARGVRVQYGHCPAPIAATIQNQIQGPPPPSTDNGNCVVLTQIPLASVTMPPGFDTASVMEIALELTGMSPNQARDFRTLFDWRAALALSTPRGIRSYEITDLDGARGMLIISSN